MHRNTFCFIVGILCLFCGGIINFGALSARLCTQSSEVPADFLFYPVQTPSAAQADLSSNPIRLGIDILVEKKISLIKGKRVGLITNPSGVNRRLESTVDVLYRHPEVKLTALFAPEHGIRGSIPAGQFIAAYIDSATGLTVYSLYGSTKKPTKEMLANIDVLVFDIQDVGSRPYTFIYTMAYAMEAAKENGIPFIVLDRPNPISGTLVDGNVLNSEFKSFIGLYPIPYVHGMTVGELAFLFNREFGIGANLTVVPMEGWKRTMTFSETGLLWIPTSPHIPTAETAIYYAATGFIGELSTLSVGVGYTLPFKVVGAPWIDGQKLADELNKRKLPGIIFRPMHWQQFYGIFNGTQVSGVVLHVTDPHVFKPFAAGIHILEAIRKLYPDKELIDGTRVSSFNLAVGNNTIANRLKSGVSAEEIIKEYQKELESFIKLRKEYLLY